MQENKTYYLYVKGQKVEVSEKIYRAYVQPERKERMREYRAKEKVSISSIERLSENGFEIEDKSQDLLTFIIEIEEQTEKLSKLRVAIAELSERDRQVVQLYFFEGKTHQEIAAVLGLARNTVTELLVRILKRLKNFF